MDLHFLFASFISFASMTMRFARKETDMKVKTFIAMRLYEAFSFLFVSFSFLFFFLCLLLLLLLLLLQETPPYVLRAIPFDLF